MVSSDLVRRFDIDVGLLKIVETLKRQSLRKGFFIVLELDGPFHLDA